jgi:hypothetical protein
MRYPNIYGRRQADPDADAAPPVVLDDSNSVVDPLQPDVRYAKELNRRHFVVAESALPQNSPPPARREPTPPPAQPAPTKSGWRGWNLPEGFEHL